MGSAANDTGDVLDAIQLGWSMAELRARFWMARGSEPRSTPGAPPRDARPENFLPLGRERSPGELAIQTQAVVSGLAAALQLDLDLVRLSYQADATGTASQQLGRLTRQLDLDEADAWPHFSEFLYAWDARIQDTLAAGSFTESAAYLLGRGLGEICWGPALARPPGGAEPSPDWSAFLGADRRGDLLRYLDRLSSYFHPLTVPAIRWSLTAWGEVAEDTDWRSQSDIVAQLNAQASLWRDFLLGQRDPESLIVNTWNLGKARTGWRVLRVFWPQVITASVGIVMLSGAAWILADPKGAVSHGLGAGLAVLGFFGITGASLHARARNTAQQLLTRVRLTYEIDLVAEATTLRPAKQVIRKYDDQRRAPPVHQQRDVLPREASHTQPVDAAMVGSPKASVQSHHEGGGNGTQNDNERNSSATSDVREVEGRAGTG
jgi:hypothetical protein